MAELKKCPFCESENLYIIHDKISIKRKTFVECQNCKATAPIKAWNNRENEFDSDKYEELVLADMERKHSENQQLLSELKAMLPTTTEAEIRAKAIDEVFEFLKSKRNKYSLEVGLDDLEIRKYKEQLKEG